MDTERLFAFKSGAVGCVENVGDMRDCIIKLSRNDARAHVFSLLWPKEGKPCT